MVLNVRRLAARGVSVPVPVIQTIATAQRDSPASMSWANVCRAITIARCVLGDRAKMAMYAIWVAVNA